MLCLWRTTWSTQSPARSGAGYWPRRPLVVYAVDHVKKWKDSAFDDVCKEIDLAGSEVAPMPRSVVKKCGGCSRHGSTGRRGASLCLRPVRPELHQISEVPHHPLLVSSRLWESQGPLVSLVVVSDLPCAQSWICHPSFAGGNYREFSILGPRTSSGQDDSQPLIIDSATDRVLFSFAGFLLYFARILRDGFVHHARPGRCAQTVPRL